MNGDDETFWEHEWNKHGTCVNTIEPDCYENYKPQVEVGEFFAKTVELFKGLDTYRVGFLLFCLLFESIGLVLMGYTGSGGCGNPP